MLNFVARVFRSWMNVILWLVLIGSAVAGLIAGGLLLGSWGFSFGYAFLGLIVGSIVGLIIVILSGGLIANYLNMVENIELIKCHLIKTGKIISGSSSGLNLFENIETNKNVEDKNARWKCPKCNNDNPNTTYQCRNCGYKLV